MDTTFLTAEGQILTVGSRVTLKEEHYWPKGEVGTVLGDHEGRYIAVLHEHDHRTQGTDFDGRFAELSPRGHKRGGWYSKEDITRFLQATLTVDALDTEAGLAELGKIIAKKDLACIDGKFFTLTPAPFKDADGILANITKATAETITSIRNQALVDVKAAKDTAKEKLLLPEITLTHVAQGLRIYKSGKDLNYVLPFHYAPKFIGRDNITPTKELSQEHQDLLRRDIFFHTRVNKDGKILDTCLFQADCKTIFQHYHGHGDDCIGINHYDDGLTVDSPGVVFAFRDRYQKSLEVINEGHMVSRSPAGLPRFETVNEASHKIDLKKVWTTKKKPAVKTETVTGEITVGSLVKVVAEHDGLNLINAVGKVIWVDGEGEDKAGGVEFLFANPVFHAIGGEHIGWYYPLECLQLMPAGTRRTRKFITPNNTEEEEETTAAPPPAPARRGHAWTVTKPKAEELTIAKLDEAIATINPTGLTPYAAQLRVGDIVKIRANVTTPKIDFGVLRDPYNAVGVIAKMMPAGDCYVDYPPENFGKGFHATLNELELAPVDTDPAKIPAPAIGQDRFDVPCTHCGRRYGEHFGGGDEVVCPQDQARYNRINGVTEGLKKRRA